MTMMQGTGRRAPRRSHVSHDYSGSTYSAGAPGTALKEPLGAPGTKPHRSRKVQQTPRRRFSRTPGSQQQFSHRGRRVEANKVSLHTVRLIIGVTVVSVVGIAIAMILSGWTTAQTFTMQELSAKETTLNNEIETLNRDVQNASSAASIAKRAAQEKMVIPDQPGILLTEADGKSVEQREPGTITRPITDINGAVDKSVTASSDPEKTKEVTGNLSSIPGRGAAAPGAERVLPPYDAPVLPPYSAERGVQSGAQGPAPQTP